MRYVVGKAAELVLSAVQFMKYKFIVLASRDKTLCVKYYVGLHHNKAWWSLWLGILPLIQPLVCDLVGPNIEFQFVGDVHHPRSHLR